MPWLGPPPAAARWVVALALSASLAPAQTPAAASPIEAPAEAPAQTPPRPIPGTAASNEPSKVIEFDLNGLHYFTQSRGDVTVMFAHIPQTLRDYAVIEVSVLNGSKKTFPIKPEDFHFRPAAAAVRGGGKAVAQLTLQALAAGKVVSQFMERGSRNDVVKLVTAYEAVLYGMQRGKGSNGYEQRRQAVIADMGPSRFNAAAAASAMVLVPVALKAGESTDGAVFFRMGPNKPLGKGWLRVETPVGPFEFETLPLETE